jgi:hypothetical protein
VCSLDLTTDPAYWKDAVRMAVIEIRRLGLYGLTISELERWVGGWVYRQDVGLTYAY